MLNSVLCAARRHLLAFQRRNCRISLIVLRRQIRNDVHAIRICPDLRRALTLSRQISENTEAMASEFDRLATLTVKWMHLQ